MTTTQTNRIKSTLLALCETYNGTVADWCVKHVRFNEPKLSGPFTLHGREYFREPLDCWMDRAVKDIVLCFGTRAGKTRIIFGGLAFIIAWDASRILYVMPNAHGTGGAQNVARTRFVPMLRAMPYFTKNFRSVRRHDFKSMQQIIGGSIIDWAGSNSPANLASNPCNIVIQDEVDKYRRLGDREADPSKLADERCKEFANPKRVKCSTPTLVSGLIWQELLKTDLRRRFLTCPHCGRHHPASRMLAIAWSREFTVLPTVNVGFVKWDKEARRKDGSWDLDRVERSARVECPHCGGHISDSNKTEMDREGVWQPTREGSPMMKGFHLPSMYSQTVETSFGTMAIRFLNAKNSIQGLQGVINSDFAEPYEAQENRAKRVAATALPFVVTGEWNKLMSVDCQARAPYFWYVIRAWKGNQSEGIAAGHCDTWDEIVEVQKANDVADVNVSVDSAWGAKSDAEVYMNCARHCEFVKMEAGQVVAVGWTPVRGFEGEKKWKDTESDRFQPYGLRAIDPFLGTSEAGQVTIFLFEFASDFFKDILTNLRSGMGGSHWAVSAAMAGEEYWRHMDGQVKKPMVSKFTGKVVERWVKRSRYWPDHLFACYHPNTDILTKKGWKKITDATVKDELATVNLGTDTIEYQKPTRRIKKHYDGPMVQAEGRTFSMSVTPSHRMVVYPRGVKNKTPMIKRACDLTIWDSVKGSASNWEGSSKPLILPGVRKSPTVKLDRKIAARLMGWFVTEGQQRHCGALHKCVPQWVKDSSKEVIAEFIDRAVLGDGWVIKNGLRDLKVIKTISRKLADDYCELGVKLGHRVRIFERKPRKSVIRGREVNGKHNEFSVYFLNVKHSRLRDGRNKPLIKITPYKGDVYCFSVPNKTLIMRHRGRTFVCGNCEYQQVARASFARWFELEAK